MSHSPECRLAGIIQLVIDFDFVILKFVFNGAFLNEKKRTYIIIYKFNEKINNGQLRGDNLPKYSTTVISFHFPESLLYTGTILNK